LTLTAWNVADFDTGLDEPKARKPYCVRFGWCHEDWENFATFAEALAFRNIEHPDGSIYNTDNCDDEGDGLTEEEHEAAL